MMGVEHWASSPALENRHTQILQRREAGVITIEISHATNGKLIPTKIPAYNPKRK